MRLSAAVLMLSNSLAAPLVFLVSTLSSSSFR